MSTSAPRFREKLYPSAWIFVATALVIPASLLVFLPISMLAGAVVASVLYAAIVVLLVVTTPTIEVDDGRTARGTCATAARASSRRRARRTEPMRCTSAASACTRDAWLLIRGWIPDVVRVGLADPSDPTPYWIISSRRADELAAAIIAARDAATS